MGVWVGSGYSQHCPLPAITRHSWTKIDWLVKPSGARIVSSHQLRAGVSAAAVFRPVHV